MLFAQLYLPSLLVKKKLQISQMVYITCFALAEWNKTFWLSLSGEIFERHK